MSKNVLIVKNISREGPGLLDLVLRENEISSKLIDLTKGEEFPDPADYSAAFVFGGPSSANDQTPKIQDELQWVKEICERGIPYFGICLGMQVMVKANGGEVHPSALNETGWRDPEGDYFEVDVKAEGEADPLLSGVNSPFKVFQLHGETARLAPNMVLLGRGKYCENQLVRIGTNAYGIQGHIELTPSMLEEWIDQDRDLQTFTPAALREDYGRIEKEYEQQGNRILTNFLRVAKLV